METEDRFRTDILDVRHDVLDVFPWETEVTTRRSTSASRTVS